jgi:competence protein ComFC
MEGRSTFFCKGCSGFFELIDPLSRCAYCFSENDGRHLCHECVQKKRWDLKMASALDYLGAVSSLIKKLKYGQMPYLAKTGAAFMTAQFFRLEWPIPDIIVCVPRREWFKGMNHSHLLAKNLSKSLGVKCEPLIKRKAGDLPQARLFKDQREELSSSSFYLKKGAEIEGKVILLVDDVITTGTTFRRSAETLKNGFPSKIYGLSLARSLN